MRQNSNTPETPSERHEVQRKGHPLGTLSELVFSQVPALCGSARIESMSSHRLQIRRTENNIPAIAAARGVLNPTGQGMPKDP